MIYINDDQIEGEDELDEDVDSASIAEDILDEVDGDEDVLEDDIEGFGILEEAEVSEEDEEESGTEADGDASLEDDAEDVDYDSFDDVDEM